MNTLNSHSPITPDAPELPYRQLVHSKLNRQRVRVQESDLCIYADVDLGSAAKDILITQRSFLEKFIQNHARFASTLQPWPVEPLAPAIVQAMIDAGQQAQVGPMAAVAGAVAEQVGVHLLRKAGEIIVENGGDIFLHTRRPATIAVYAGKSPLSLRLGLRVDSTQKPLGVCTSSGTVGHSLSLGKADAVCVLSPSCSLADAAATAIGNRLQRPADIASAIKWGKRISGVQGILVIMGDKMGAWGKMDLAPL